MMTAPDPDQLREIARASVERPTPWETAFHEAGHVVAGWAFMGMMPDSVYITEQTPDHAGRTVTRGLVLDVLAVGELPSEVRVALADSARHSANTLVAGEIAGSLALGHSPDELAEPDTGWDDGTVTDRVLALGVARCWAPRTPFGWLDARVAETVPVLVRRWRTVQQVATALFQHRSLSREYLWDMVENGTLSGEQER